MKPAGIKGIADALRISIGTVDRALHGRSGISPRTRELVLAKAKELGYRPNAAARSLKLNRTYRLAVYLPLEHGAFFDAIYQGIAEACRATSVLQLEPHLFRYPRLDYGDRQLLSAHLQEPWDACIVSPGNPARIAPVLRQTIAAGTPVFCVSTDAPETGRIGAVTVDAYTSGAIAADLLSHVVKTAGPLAVITGDLSTLDHAEKVRGFNEGLSRWAAHLAPAIILETHEQASQAHRLAASMLASRQRPVALYVTNAMSVPVLQACAERGLLAKLPLLTTDLFPEILPYLETGAVLATLHQRPATQGSLIVEQIVRYLCEGRLERNQINLAPHLVMRSNLELFRGEVARATPSGVIQPPDRQRALTPKEPRSLKKRKL